MTVTIPRPSNIGRNRPSGVRPPSESTATSRWPSIVAALLLAAGYGIGAGLWTPRGPNDTTEALVSMALAIGVGVFAGVAWPSAWTMVVAPSAFVVAFEVIRLDATGPTVDGIVLDNQYGVMAFVVGRMLHGLLVLLPMAVGVAHGRRWVRRHRAARTVASSGFARVRAATGRVVLGGATVLILVLAVALVRPASTDPILGSDGERLSGSIAELVTVDIGGHDQSMMIRGNDVDDPVVLFLAGGPGGSELGSMSRYARPLEQDFVVVTWDQLGTGRSTGQFDPEDTLGVARSVADTIEVTEYLRDRFGVDQLYLVGNSWGTLLGVQVVNERPDLYAAYVGAGQMVDAVETDRMFYEDALAHAEATGDEALRKTLLDNGPPPYDDLLDMAPIVASERSWNDYSDIDGFPGLREPTDNLFVTEYSLMDQVRSMANLLDTYVAMYPDLYGIDLRETTTLDVPVYLVQGEYEARGRAVLAGVWFDELDAPDKDLIVFERSGHRPWVQEPERFAQVMTETVLARSAPQFETQGTPATEPLAEDELRSLFAEYDPAVWPVHVVAALAAFGALWLLWRNPGPRADRWISVLLAGSWAWLGVVFFGVYAAELDPFLSALYGAAFLGQAFLLLRAGVIGRRLRFSVRHGVAPRLGLSALAYALVVYPLIGIVLGHGYPEAPLFGTAPCPTTIATFGFLLLARPPMPRGLVVIPFVWAVLAPLAAVGHGYPEDLGLAVAGLVTLVVVVRRRRHAGDDADPSTTEDEKTEELVRR